MAVSKRLRYEILRRDNHQCRYCGIAAPEVVLTVDHVLPTALGGNDEPSNLVAACRDCNAGKSASSPDAQVVADVDQRAVQWAQAMQVAIEQRTTELAADRARTDRFDSAWSSWVGVDGQIPRDVNWRHSVLRFLAGGLNDQFLTDAVATAMGNDRLPDYDRWRYFCGICWRELDTIRERTAALLPPSSPVDPSRPQSGGGGNDDCEDNEFPFMEMFSIYLDDVLTALNAGERVAKVARVALWDGMWKTSKVWRDGDPDYDGLVDESGEPLTRYEIACDFMSSYVARDMYEIDLLRREGHHDGS